MKKLNQKLAFAFAALVLFACGESKETAIKNKSAETTLSKEHINGKVKEITETAYDIDDPDGDAKTYESSREYREFDERGNVIKRIIHTAEDSDEDTMGHKVVYKYDDKGNWIGDSTFNTDGSLEDWWTMKYDDNGNQLERIKFNPDGTKDYRYVLKYDDKGNQTEEAFYNAGDSMTSKVTYKYDDKGNKIEAIASYDDGKNYRQTYLYDDRGNNIERKSFLPEGSLELMFTFKYDDKGNKIEEVSYNKDGVTIEHRSTYKYDDKGNEIEEYTIMPDRDTSLQKISYDMGSDKKGNWLKKNVYSSNAKKPDMVIERKIVYY